MMSNSKRLILGCAQLGLQYGIANRTGKPDRNTAVDLLSFAYESGIRILDTAVAYGDSQKIIGDYLEQNPSQNWEVITKVSTNTVDLRQNLDSIRQSLKRTPNLVLFHTKLNPDHCQTILDQIRRNFPSVRIGISVYEPNDIDEVLKIFEPEYVQVPMNLFDQRMERSGKLQQLADRNIKIHIRSVFMQGAVFLDEANFSDRFPTAMAARSKLLEIAEAEQLGMGGLALAFILSNPLVNGVLIGAELPSQLTTHFKTANVVLTEEIQQQIREIVFDDPTVVDPRRW